MKARSPLRYPGGKTRAIKYIMPNLPTDIIEYREPFLGGGSVFLAIKSLFGNRIKHYWLNDINFDLICFWTYVRDDVDNLIKDIYQLRDKYPHGHDLYNYLRDADYSWTNSQRAVRFFIMNRITFSGVMDAGGYSQQAFEKRFTLSSIDRVKSVSYFLQNTKITCEDYSHLLEADGNSVFVFLDPPYWSATKSRLYGKRGELHTGFDHEEFACDVAACQHRWLMTYDDSDYIRDKYAFAQIDSWQLQYGMNNYKQANAAKGNELFIKNY